HKKIEDICIDKKQVKQLWRVRYVFFRRIPDLSDSFEDKLAMLEMQMKELRGN
ncbi:MAG: hypothetical protein ACI9V9_000725, partial [Oleispira sp.]